MMRCDPRLAALAVSALMAACGSTPVATDSRPAAAQPVAVGSSPAAAPSKAVARTAAPSTVASVVLPPHKNANSELYRERSVYFDFDTYMVKPQFTTLIERHGKYLREGPMLIIRIEGFADERGSAEYNLALGQRRAEAVLRVLKIQGARDIQMEAVSYGEERPRVNGHDEAAWGENRRADVVYR